MIDPTKPMVLLPGNIPVTLVEMDDCYLRVQHPSHVGIRVDNAEHLGRAWNYTHEGALMGFENDPGTYRLANVSRYNSPPLVKTRRKLRL